MYLGWQYYHFGIINFDTFGSIPIIVVKDSGIFLSYRELFNLDEDKIQQIKTDNKDAIEEFFNRQIVNRKESNLNPKYIVLGINEFYHLCFSPTFIFNQKIIENRENYSLQGCEVALLPVLHYLYVCTNPKDSFLYLS